MPSATDICDDLRDEHESLDSVVKALTPRDWRTVTPAQGWDVADCISHLRYFDEQATLAITDNEAFEEHRAAMLEAFIAAGSGSAPGTPDVQLSRSATPEELLSCWRSGRKAFLLAAREAAGQTPLPRIPWYGPPMSLTSFVTARVMETWAHGADIRDALGIPLESSPRLRHICHIGFGARSYTFAAHNVDDPGTPVAFEVDGSGGETWHWGPDDAPESIRGSALDFALVFTQRRHPSRTGIEAHGKTAQLWLSIAQAFAGPPTIVSADR